MVERATPLGLKTYTRAEAAPLPTDREATAKASRVLEIAERERCTPVGRSRSGRPCRACRSGGGPVSAASAPYEGKPRRRTWQVDVRWTLRQAARREPQLPARDAGHAGILRTARFVLPGLAVPHTAATASRLITYRGN